MLLTNNTTMTLQEQVKLLKETLSAIYPLIGRGAVLIGGRYVDAKTAAEKAILETDSVEKLDAE